MVMNGNEELNMEVAFTCFFGALGNVLYGLWTADRVKPGELRQATIAVLILTVALSATGTAISLSLLFARGRKGRLMRRQFQWLRGFAIVVLLATLVIRGVLFALAAQSTFN